MFDENFLKFFEILNYFKETYSIAIKLMRVINLASRSIVSVSPHFLQKFEELILVSLFFFHPLKKEE